MNFYNSTLTGANLSGANLKNAHLSVDHSTGLTSAIVNAATVYNQWTVFPEDFDPVARGLKLEASPRGDLDADDVFDADDVDILANTIVGWTVMLWWLPVPAFDMNGDSAVDLEDHRTWVKDLAQTWYGDANLDGQFSSEDLVAVFQAGLYEDAFEANAGWATGDWDGDAKFTSSDLVLAFQDGGYEQGARTDVAVVPEPTSIALATCAGLLLSALRRARRPVGYTPMSGTGRHRHPS